MDFNEKDTDVLVIGAGIAGLTAAAELQRGGRRVLLLDKGRGVGGRLASRRIDGATFDHGAQFITTRDPRFEAVLERGRERGAVEEWGYGVGGVGAEPRRWRGKPSMSGLAKYLACGLDVHLEVSVVALGCGENRWRAETTSGRTFTAGAVVLTPPVPQALAILDAGGTVVAPEVRARLAAIEYERCLAVMAVLDGPSGLGPSGGFRPEEGPVGWIADNQLKGVSVEPAVTVHGRPEFSLKHWDGDWQESGRVLLGAAAPWIGAGVKTFQVHGWRYSKPLEIAEEWGVVLRAEPMLVMAGDAFGGSGVEGAALSGWGAAERILWGSGG